ncbi:MAG: glutaminyl-peptide cyclotransferase [bacterium]|nr:glutaminyl-peptide cyclotransferase [bacterium]
MLALGCCIGAACPAPDPTDPPVDPPPPPPPPPTIPVYGYLVINEYPHDSAAFTQGLVYHGGVLYEGTGLYGQSSLREVTIATGQVVRQHNLAANVFGEGIALWGDRIIQLTWKAGVGYVYNRADFAVLGAVSYVTQGWGLTHDGTRLIMSDGSSTLRFRDPATFAESGTVTVRANGIPVTNLNELEYVGGEVYANIWTTNRIARIDPATGDVLAWIDLTGILDPADVTGHADVLNGIAYDAVGDRLFVTGKLWPKLYEIELVAPAG